jgi:hypothetical protein
MALWALIPAGSAWAVDPNAIPDPLFASQWPLHNVGQSSGTPDADIDWLEAHEAGVSGQGVVVAIGTPGSFPTVRCLNSQILPQLWQNPGEIPENGVDDDGNGFIDDQVGANFAYSNGDVCVFATGGGHDTSVSRLAVSPVDGALDVGVAPGARLMILAGWDADTFFTEALPYAESMGARVIVVPYTGIPLSGSGDPEADCSSTGGGGGIDRPAILAASDVLVLWGFPDEYPGCDPSAVDFAAPGSRGWASGVAMSWALPIAAGTAVLALERNPALERATLLQRLRDGADPVGPLLYDASGWNSTYGSGRINALGTLLLGDLDGDGIDGDGDGSGVVGDAPCAPGQSQGCDDSCPYTANADQADGGSVGPASAPDGIGDACQCGDVSDDGVVTLVDLNQIKEWLGSSRTIPPSPEFVPGKCDVSGPVGCSLMDLSRVRQAVGAGNGSLLEQVCGPAGGR